MLDIEYRILEKIYASDSRCCSWIDILNAFSPNSDPNITDTALHALVDTGFIYSDAYSKGGRISGSVFLSDKGNLALLSERESRQARAKQEKEAKDYRIRKEKQDKLTFYLSIFMAIITVCSIVVSIFLSLI